MVIKSFWCQLHLGVGVGACSHTHTHTCLIPLSLCFLLYKMECQVHNPIYTIPKSTELSFEAKLPCMVCWCEVAKSIYLPHVV